MVPIWPNKSTRTTDHICENHVMIAKLKLNDAIQGNGTVDRCRGIGIAITLPVHVVFQNDVAAVEPSGGCIVCYLSTAESMDASIPTAIPENQLATGADSKNGAGILEGRVHVF